MLISFTVNTAQIEQYKRVDKVIKLIGSIEKYSNTDWLGEAYIQLVKGNKDIDNININKYSMRMEKLSMLERSKKEVCIVSEDEFIRGFKGILLDNTESYEEEGIEKYGIAEEFLDLRELVLAVEKKDIWLKCNLCMIESDLLNEGIISNDKETKDLARLLKIVEEYYEGAIETVVEVQKKGLVYKQVYEQLEG